MTLGDTRRAELLGNSTQTEFKVLNESLGQYDSSLENILEHANAVHPITLVIKKQITPWVKCSSSCAECPSG